MQLLPSERKQTKIKMALQGISGSGKTMSAILLAKGLTNDNLSKVGIIDTERGSSHLYAHLGSYNVLKLEQPCLPEKYIEAIDICLTAGMEVIVIDGISQCWNYLLGLHASLTGNSFTNWKKVTAKQDVFINKILHAPVHIIVTMRSKQAYVLNLKNGKYIPEKVGLKAVQRNDVDYEFDLVFDIDIKHFAVSNKDRTNLFTDKQAFVINSLTGMKIRNWALSNENLKQIKQEI
ncbi:AAA family ATPase [Algibacter sp. 2305UL17-15]|uniref:AAA family ATPase n=1 Tax=Algibacter sp. 2305UL17-15 TaxID=3231268 RepID=UPI0034583D1F